MIPSRRSLLVGLFTVVISASTLLASGSPTAAGSLELSTLSGRPDTVTGGDALVQVGVPRDVALNQVSVAVQGDDVTQEFHVDKADRTLTGLIDGLAAGENAVTATVRGRPNLRAELTVVNHPIEGPVFSGPKQQPFACATAEFNIPVVGGTLGEPIDDNCSIETRIDYFYRTTADEFAPWPTDATTYPDDLATTVTSEGTEVPYIVRMVTGTVNRAIYQTTVLQDPLAEPEPSFANPPGAWNGATIFTLGGGCTNGWYRQGASTGGVTDDFMLSQGYAVMSSSLNVFGNNCSELTAAESAMMVKEQFVQQYGPVEHTIGYGCSGGSYQAHQITDDYPGIFDGIIVGCSFPEVASATVSFITDAWLLDHYLSNTTWTNEEKRAVTGFRTYATAPNVANGARRIDPRAFCDIVPEDQRYDPETNPAGVRCGVFDHMVNAFGRDPDTGFARRPLDNVGIQYGLQALNDGVITPEQFLDLNENIGGFDDDANLVPDRTNGDLDAIRASYQTGRLTNGGGGLADVPIIDYRAYQDDNANGDIHVRYHTLSMRERLEKANGTTVNHVSLLEDARYGGFSTNSPLVRHAITQMDQWLTDIAADTSGGTSIEKIAAARPQELVEGCNTRAETPEFLAQDLNRDPASECEQLYPSASFPREVAGADIAADVIKCQVKEPDPADYDVTWTDDQWSRLGTIFTDGVCDYAKPGVEQQDPLGTWLRF